MKGCSCKQAEYNPTEIEAANKRAEADAAAAGEGQRQTDRESPCPASRAASRSACRRDRRPANLDLDVTGSNPPARRRFTCGGARRAEAACARSGRGTTAGSASRGSLGGSIDAGQSTVVKKAAEPPVAPPAQ